MAKSKTKPPVSAPVSTKLLKLEQLRAVRDLQARDRLNDETVTEYVDSLQRGCVFPPLEAVRDAEGTYWLWDGFHRLETYRRHGVLLVDVNVREGTKEDAAWLALSANKVHGLKRSNADKRRAVHLALEAKPELSNMAIAEHVGVSHTFVAIIRSPSQVATVATCEDRTGRDGKTYRVPAKPRNSKAQVATVATCEDGEQPIEDAKEHPLEWPDEDDQADDQGETPQPTKGKPQSKPKSDPVDKVGLTIPVELREVFKEAGKFDEALSMLRHLQNHLHQIATSPAGAELVRHLIHRQANDAAQPRHSCEHLANAIRKLRFARPYASACPYCVYAGNPDPGSECEACRGRGWVTESVWENAPRDYREATVQERGVQS